jgi:hypothetical protein
VKCIQCGGPFHPASGHQWSKEAVVCGRCHRNFIDWLKIQLKRITRKKRFYVEAVSSIRAQPTEKETKPMKEVAQTLKDIPNNELYRRILDGTDPVDDVIEAMKKHWSYDLYTRRPSPALLENGALKPTDLDLACFLSALIDRKAVINIPSYTSRRAPTKKAGEHVISKHNRHGHVTGLTSNKEVFSFSIRIFDMNVMKSDGEGGDSIGAYRNFMLVDLEGDWYDGWRRIEFVPSRKENSFLEDKSLWTGNVVYFDKFIHPNRWISFYGQWYVLTKILVQRLREEASFRRAEVKEMMASGVAQGDAGKGDSVEFEPVEKGESKPISVLAFEAEVDCDAISPFTPSPQTAEGLANAKARAHRLQYTDIPELSFAVRATEMAFSDRAKLFDRISGTDGTLGDFEEPFPSWIRGAKWDHSYKIKRTVWNRLVLTQHVPFAQGLALRYRVREKTERVAV